MTSISSLQVIGVPVSERTLAAASRALGFLAGSEGGAAFGRRVSLGLSVVACVFLDLDMTGLPEVGETLGSATIVLPGSAPLPRVGTFLQAIPAGIPRFFRT